MLTLRSLKLFPKLLEFTARFEEPLDSFAQAFESSRHGNDDRDSLVFHHFNDLRRIKRLLKEHFPTE